MRNESVLIHINNLPRAPQPNTSPKQVPSQTPNSRLVLTSPPFLVSYVCPYRIYDMILVVHLIMPICGPCLSKDMGAIRGLASLIARSRSSRRSRAPRPPPPPPPPPPPLAVPLLAMLELVDRLVEVTCDN